MPKVMRILFLLTQDLTSPNGAGRILPLSKSLVKLGHKVCIVGLHSDFNSIRDSQFELDGVEVHYVAQMHVRKSGNKKSYLPDRQLLPIIIKSTWELSRAAVNIPIDIVHICKPHPMNSLAGLLVKLIRRPPILLDYDDYEAGTTHFNSAWQRSGISFFEDWMPHQVNHVTTHTSFLKRRLLSLGVPEEKISFLPNGVDIDRFSKRDERAVNDLRSELNLSGKLVVSYVGSLSLASHPVDLLINAFAKVHQIISQTHLLIVGGGEDFERLREIASKKGLDGAVHFCGRISPGEVPLYYHLSDVSVEPVADDEAGRSRLPIKMFESWASRVPFVTADVGDRKLLLENPRAGILTLPGNATSLSDAIINVLTDLKLADELRKTGFERAKEYSWSSISQKMESLYSGILQKKDIKK